MQRRFSFVGLSTYRSAIMNVFPEWADHIGMRGVEVVGIDFPLHAERRSYRDVVERIKAGDLELGSLVTAHKIDLFAAWEDLFDYVDP